MNHELTTDDVMVLESETPVRVVAWCSCNEWSWSVAYDADARERIEFEFERHAAGLAERSAA